MIVTRNLLRSEVQREALKQFVHRYTGQHRPAWSLKPMPNRRPYPVQFRDDRDWLEHTFGFAAFVEALEHDGGESWEMRLYQAGFTVLQAV